MKAPRNALAVERFLRAGGNVFGKSNVPTLLADWETVNPVYGKTVSPWNHERTPGGSSGGAAAALAAGLTGLEAGSDIGGSIRNPAHYCGVYGHKSTYGVCSMAGHALPGAAHPADISVIGPLARSAEDLELAFSVMAGPDDIDGAGWKLALSRPARKTLRGWRVAVITTHPTAETDATVQQSIGKLAQFLAGKGAKVSERALPAFDLGEAHRVFIQLLRGATSGRLAADVFTKLAAAKEALAPEDHGYYAQMVRANVQPHRDWLDCVQSPPPDAARVGRVLQGVGRAAVPERGERGFPALDARRALGAHDCGERQAPAGHHADVVGGHGGDVLPAGDRRAHRLVARRPASQRADRRAAIRRPHDDTLRAADRAGVLRVRTAAGVRLKGEISDRRREPGVSNSC